MHYKRFRAESVRDALRAVREELGPQALVLSTTMVAAPGWRGWVGCREVEIVAAAERGAESRVSENRRQESDERSFEAGVADVTARLAAAGFDPTMASDVAESMPSASRRGASLHSLRGALAHRLSTLATADEEFAKVEVFVGPPGAGKTTTIAKIASQARATDGRRLGLIAADGLRIGAVEQLRTYAEILHAPFRIARNSDELEAALSARRRQPVLVDTAGRSPSDPAARELFDVVAHHADARTHLVLPAGTPPRTAKRIFETYAEARPSRVILTRIDEAESLAPLVSLLREQQLPISYLGTGQRVPDDLCRATADMLAMSALGELPVQAALRG
ncbi:MAG: AAA family ATPase [Acidobacteria bacterium]|nr:AAA family ATPase [Acidobacteriota bacterium]